MQEEVVEMVPVKNKSQIYTQIVEFDDPQKALGAGISSYHQQIVHLGALMTILLLLHIPAMTIYGGYGFYDSAMSSLTLGNMGFTESHCLTDSVIDTSLSLKCGVGMISDLVDFGITTKFEDQESCTRKVTTQYCNKFINSEAFRNHFKTHCIGRTDC